MEMKEFPKIREELVRVIEELMKRYLYKLRDMYTEDPEEEVRDLSALLDDLWKLVVKAKKIYEGGYTIFVYSVLLGVLRSLSKVEEDLYIYLDELNTELWKEIRKEMRGGK